MDFTFTDDQLLFQESVRDFLVNEVTPERIRASWETESGRVRRTVEATRGTGADRYDCTGRIRRPRHDRAGFRAAGAGVRIRGAARTVGAHGVGSGAYVQDIGGEMPRSGCRE